MKLALVSSLAVLASMSSSAMAENYAFTSKSCTMTISGSASKCNNYGLFGVEEKAGIVLINTSDVVENGERLHIVFVGEVSASEQRKMRTGKAYARSFFGGSNVTRLVDIDAYRSMGSKSVKDASSKATGVCLYESPGNLSCFVQSEGHDISVRFGGVSFD